MSVHNGSPQCDCNFLLPSCSGLTPCVAYSLLCFCVYRIPSSLYASTLSMFLPIFLLELINLHLAVHVTIYHLATTTDAHLELIVHVYTKRLPISWPKPIAMTLLTRWCASLFVMSERIGTQCNQASRLFEALLDDIVVDVALQTHQEVARNRRKCDLCHTQYVSL